MASLRKNGFLIFIKTFLEYSFFVILAIITVGPVIWLFLSGLKPVREIRLVPPRLFPTEWLWENYYQVLVFSPIGRSIIISLVVLMIVLFSVLFTSSLSGYCLSKLRFPGKSVILVVLVSTLMFPTFIKVLPLYVFIVRMGWLNSFQGLAFPFLVTGMGVFLMRQFILSIPDSLIEAARIDGYSEFRIYLTIVLPLTKAGLITLSILMLQEQWNEFLWALMVVRVEKMYTIPLALYSLLGMYEENLNLMFVGAFIGLLLPVVIFLIGQKYIVKGYVLSGMK